MSIKNGVFDRLIKDVRAEISKYQPSDAPRLYHLYGLLYSLKGDAQKALAIHKSVMPYHEISLKEYLRSLDDPEEKLAYLKKYPSRGRKSYWLPIVSPLYFFFGQDNQEIKKTILNFFNKTYFRKRDHCVKFIEECIRFVESPERQSTSTEEACIHLLNGLKRSKQLGKKPSDFIYLFMELISITKYEKSSPEVIERLFQLSDPYPELFIHEEADTFLTTPEEIERLGFNEEHIQKVHSQLFGQ